MRMPRVTTYFDKTGRPHPNTDRRLIPFHLMTEPGDWCEVEQSKFCLAGNVASMCSLYSIQLGRRFKFKDLNNGIYKITVTTDKVKRYRRRNSVAPK